MIPPEQLPRGSRNSGGTGIAVTQPKSAMAQGELGLSCKQWSGLCAYLERQLDEARADTARALHDELGGLLVATKMDLGHLQHSVRGQEPELRERLSRAQLSLDAVVATERRVGEELQPGLLTHIGLFAALRWYVDHLNTQGQGNFEADIAPEEPFVGARERVALYRSVQAALQMQIAVAGLRDIKKPESILKACEEIAQLEKRADQAIRAGIAKLFKSGADPLTVMKWKEIFELIESAVDRVDDVANVLEGVVLEHS